MKILVDTDDGTVTDMSEPHGHRLPLGSAEGFELVSKAWLRAGWDAKYVYSFTWLGRPIIQLPEDVLRLQEVIWQLRPTVIVETGVAHGGSLVLSASLLRLLGGGRVIGVDIQIRPVNRDAIESHPLSDMITLVEGSSIDPSVVAKVKSLIGPADRVLVLLDSNHQKKHVLAELEAYGVLVTPGMYVVAMDGIMQEVAGAPRTDPDWSWNNPISAINDFLNGHPDFRLTPPPFAFNEGAVQKAVTYWPSAFLQKVHDAK